MIKTTKTKSYFSIPLILCFFCCSAAYAQVIEDSSYFPLAIGNQWIYRTSDSTYADTETVVDTQRVKGRLYYGFALNYSDQNLWFRKDSNKVYIAETLTIQPDTTDIKEYLMYDFSANVRESWDVAMTGIINCDYGGTITLESKNDSIVTPVGTFMNCYCFSHRPPCRDAGRPGEWFAVGVGRVAYNEVTYFGQRNFVLANSIITTSVPNENYSPAINSYHIWQNYPNPFNPTTTIVFQLPLKSFVTLEIYNVLGQRIETLVKSELNAGRYSVLWNALNQTSGIYFCKITANNFSQSIKLILIR